MLESIRKVAALPDVSVEALLSVGVVAGFFGLLLQNQIQPVVIYLLQIYLSV